MRNEKIVDRLMSLMPEDWRYRWCEAEACGCMEAVNCSGKENLIKVGASPLTKEEWEDWCQRHKLIRFEIDFVDMTTVDDIFQSIIVGFESVRMEYVS